MTDMAISSDFKIFDKISKYKYLEIQDVQKMWVM